MVTRATDAVLDDGDGLGALEIRSVTFGYRGVDYEADLCPGEREALAAVFGRVLSAARAVQP